MDELSEYERLPWYHRWARWWWWKPRVLWWMIRDRGAAVRDHHTGEVTGHFNWRGVWKQSNAIADNLVLGQPGSVQE